MCEKCDLLQAERDALMSCKEAASDEQIVDPQELVDRANCYEADHEFIDGHLLKLGAQEIRRLEAKVLALQSWEVSSRATFQHIEELISGHDEFVCQDVQRAINQQVRPNGRDPNCEACHGDGEYLGHSPDCDDDLCALNGDMYSCVGEVVQCDCVPAPLGGSDNG